MFTKDNFDYLMEALVSLGLGSLGGVIIKVIMEVLEKDSKLTKLTLMIAITPLMWRLRKVATEEIDDFIQPIWESILKIIERNKTEEVEEA